MLSIIFDRFGSESRVTDRNDVGPGPGTYNIPPYFANVPNYLIPNKSHLDLWYIYIYYIFNIIQPKKFITVKKSTTIAAKYSQKALSLDIAMYLVSGFNYFLKHTNDEIYIAYYL